MPGDQCIDGNFEIIELFIGLCFPLKNPFGIQISRKRRDILYGTPGEQRVGYLGEELIDCNENFSARVFGLNCVEYRGGGSAKNVGCSFCVTVVTIILRNMRKMDKITAISLNFALLSPLMVEHVMVNRSNEV